MLAPRVHALLVVLAALDDGRARQLGDVATPADVVRMHVRDDDQLDGCIELVEQGPPTLLRRSRAQSGVDEDPAAGRRTKEVAVHMIEPEWQREGRAADPLLDIDHA